LNVEYNRLCFCIVVSSASSSVRLTCYSKFSPLYTAKKAPATWGSEFGVSVTEFGRALSEIGQILPKSHLWFRFRPNSAHMKVAGEYNSQKLLQ